jgi:hypothetical protein
VSVARVAEARQLRHMASVGQTRPPLRSGLQSTGTQWTPLAGSELHSDHVSRGQPHGQRGPVEANSVSRSMQWPSKTSSQVGRIKRQDADNLGLCQHLQPCQVSRGKKQTTLANQKSTVMLSFKREAVDSVGQSSHISRSKQHLHTWVSVFSAALRSASISFSSAFVLRSWSPCSSSSCSVFAPTSLVSSANRRMLRVESSDCGSPP